MLRRASVRVVGALGLEAQVRKHVLSRMHAAGRGSHGKRSWEQQAWTALKGDVRPLIARNGPITVGPWLSEVGFEILYWIPFLRWLVRHFEIDPARLTAVSRGGAGCWYRELCGSYLDIFDFMSVEEYHELTKARWAATGGQKQGELGKLDLALLKLAGDQLDWNRHTVLHPSLMYRFFQRYWKGATPMQHVLKHTDYKRLPTPDAGEWATRLPADFIAVKFYFRPSFPDTRRNRESALRIVESLAQHVPVVLLNTGLSIDDHVEFSPQIAGRVVRLLEGVPPEQNLHVQSLAIARSRGFVGTYGGLSYLAPAYGVPSVALYSAPEHFLPSHLDVARRAATSTGGALSVVDVEQMDIVALLGASGTERAAARS